MNLIDDILTNCLELPHPKFGYEIGPERARLKAPFPKSWLRFKGRCLMRVKTRYILKSLGTHSDFALRKVRERLFDLLHLRIIEDSDNPHEPYPIWYDFGTARETSESVFVPAAGGYWFALPGFRVWYADLSRQVFDFKGDLSPSLPEFYGQKLTLQPLIRVYFSNELDQSHLNPRKHGE